MNTNSANSAYEKNEKTVDKYIKAIKKEFPIYRKGEKRYLKRCCVVLCMITQ